MSADSCQVVDGDNLSTGCTTRGRFLPNVCGNRKVLRQLVIIAGHFRIG